MNTEPPFFDRSLPRQGDVSHEASAWFALMNGGAPTDAEREALKQWIAAHASHRQAYAELENLWAASAMVLQQRAAPAPVQISRRRFVGLGIAACTAAIAIGSTRFWLQGASSPFADVRTAVGERRKVSLPDGSTVELAGNAALNVEFTAGKRSVELLQGEVFFSVLPSQIGMLKVKTDAGLVAASEGDFCLSCEHAAASLTVSRHRVHVTTASQQTDLEEGLSMSFSASHSEPIQRADLDQVLAWRNGRLVFFDKPLLAVVDELQRWREGKIFIPDARLAARRVSLILNLERPEQMLEVLSKALSVKVARYTDLVTVIQPA